jgi:two-component system cell cycle response regulator CtrA
MSARPKKVLLVDDDMVSSMIVSLALGKLNWNINTVKGGAEAISAMAWDRYDLVVTDLIMPDVDGWEVIRKARQAQKGAKVIAISGGMGDRLNSAKALEVAGMLGADVTLSKPIDPAKFMEIAKQLLGVSDD